jgi:putative ABC transport system ATP-binding protein
LAQTSISLGIGMTSNGNVEPKNPTQAVLQLDSVTHVYGTGSTAVRALDDVSFTLGRSEAIALVGPSGSGKTTLLQLAGAVDRPTVGRVLHSGQDLATLKARELTTHRRRQIGFVFQMFNLVPGLNARDNVALVARLDGVPRIQAREAARDLLALVGLAHRNGHLPSELSGGEQQRVAIARALINEPSLILADEPTGSLDRSAGQRVVDLLMRTAIERQASLLLVTHDSQLISHTDQTLTIADGRLQRPSGARAFASSHACNF